MSFTSSAEQQELTQAALSCFSEYGRFMHSRHVWENIRERGLAKSKPPLGPITPEEVVDATDPEYMDMLLRTVSISAKYDSMTEKDYDDIFSKRLEDMNKRYARLGKAFMALLPEEGFIESFGVSEDRGRVVIDADGIHYYSDRNVTKRPLTLNPNSSDFYAGALDIEVTLPYLCVAAADLVK